MDRPPSEAEPDRADVPEIPAQAGGLVRDPWSGDPVRRLRVVAHPLGAWTDLMAKRDRAWLNEREELV